MSVTTPPSPLVAACSDAMRSVMHGLSREGCSTWFELDISMGQLKALMALAGKGPQPIGELGRALGIAEPSASLLVDKLEAQKLATREPDALDKRRTLVTPTAAAQELVDRLHQMRTVRLTDWLGQLEPSDLEALSLGLGALARIAKASPATACAATEATV